MFLKTAVMAQLGSPAWVLAAWVVAGALSLAGALTYAELGAMFPLAGGEYIYLREGWGRFAGFLYGWTRFWIGTPGSIAAYAVGTATFVGGGTPVALGVIALFTGVNCLNVKAGGGVQTALTALKVALIVGLAAAALGSPSGDFGRLSAAGGFPGWSAFGAMVLAALWAYDGWNNLPMAAGEVRDPGRNVPRALLFGSLAVLAIYLAINAGYFHALPLADIVTSNSNLHPDAPSVASRVAAALVGPTGKLLITAAMAIAAVSAMTGAMLTGARVPYAVAKDGLAPKMFARVAAGARVPRVSVLVQGAWASVLAMSGKFDDLTDAVVFASWLFYAMNAVSVLVLRRREPDRERPFRVPGFPIVPIVFIAVAVLLLANTLVTTPMVSLFGVGVMGLGAVVYAVVLRRRPS